MKNYNEEYFFLGLVNNPNYPMLDLDDDFEDYAMDFLRAKPIDYAETIQLMFSEPVPKNPQMADYHSFITSSPVFSEKLKKVIEDIHIKDIQFIPVLIRNEKDEFIKGFHAIKVCNLIHCADLERSEYDLLGNGKIGSFSKLVLDNQKLDEISLADRLIFAVGEKRTYVLYHISVVEKMLDAAPRGMTVYRLAGWDSSAPFYDAYGNYLKGLMK